MKRVISDISQWTALTLMVRERWAKRPRPFVVTLTGAPKTAEQLGYLHAEVLPKLTIALFDAGEIKNRSEGAAKYWLKRRIGYGTWYNFGEKDIVFDPDSFQRATIETLIQAIDEAIEQASLRHVHINPPRSHEKASN